MGWKIKYLRSAKKGFARMDPAVRARIRRFLEQRVAAAENPRDYGKALVSPEQLWRYRVGDYRIICELRDKELVVLVIRVAHRAKAYRE